MNGAMIKKNISQNITKFRKAAGLNQKELARALGVKPSRISNWETGLNLMDIDTLFRVCEILNVSINDMYGIYPDGNLQLTYEEQLFIKKYRILDKYGKTAVSVLLDNEMVRIEETGSSPVIRHFPDPGPDKEDTFDNGNEEDLEQYSADLDNLIARNEKPMSRENKLKLVKLLSELEDTDI